MSYMYRSKSLNEAIGFTLLLVTLFIVAFFCVGLQDKLLGSEKPLSSRTMQVSTNGLEVAWVYEDEADFFSPPPATDQADTLYSFTPRNGLVAFDTAKQVVIWRAGPDKMCYGGGGGLIVSHQSIYLRTPQGVIACDTKTGQYIWDVKLGTGHVGIRWQLEADHSVLRVYYGDDVYELDPRTGEIIRERKKNNLVWIENQVEIYINRTDQAFPSRLLVGKDAVTGQQLWETETIFFTRGRYQRYDEQTLLVTSADKELCAFNFRVGKYVWCIAGNYLTYYVGIKNTIGYVLRNDFVLVKIDLQTGAILAETEFFPKQLPPENEKYSYNYFVTVTQNDTVVVYFEDSQQLFGLRER